MAGSVKKKTRDYEMKEVVNSWKNSGRENSTCRPSADMTFLLILTLTFFSVFLAEMMQNTRQTFHANPAA